MSQSENTNANTGSASHWLGLSVLVIIADQISKWWIYTNIEIADRISVLPVLDITHRHNTGAAFSFLAGQGGWQRWFFIILACVVSLVILGWLRRLPRRGQTLLAIGLALILGGALGNVIDRVHYGFVVDFILMGYKNIQFPFAFNIADTAISIGAAFLIIDSIFGGEKKAP